MTIGYYITDFCSCFCFSSSVRGLISSEDSAKFACPVLAAWACCQDQNVSHLEDYLESQSSLENIQGEWSVVGNYFKHTPTVCIFRCTYVWGKWLMVWKVRTGDLLGHPSHSVAFSHNCQRQETNDHDFHILLWGELPRAIMLPTTAYSSHYAASYMFSSKGEECYSLF